MNLNVGVARLCSIATILLSIFSIAITIAKIEHVAPDYQMIWMLPVAFLMAFLLFLRPHLKSKDVGLTAIFLTALLFLKSVLHPMLVATAGEFYIGQRYMPLFSSDLRFATYLSAYETILAAAFLHAATSFIRKERAKPPAELFIRGNKITYAGLFLVAVLVYATIGQEEHLVSFFFLSAELESVHLDGSLNLLARQILVIAFAVAFLLAVDFCKKKYKKTRRGVFVFFAVAAAVILIGVIVGDRRSVQLFTAILATWILLKAFPSHGKKIASAVLFSAAVVFFLMTLYRLNVQYSGSYGAALGESNFGGSFWITTMQLYFSGVDSIATALSFSENQSVTLANFVFDHFRAVFGLNFLLRDQMQITSQLYNSYLYGNEQSTGQLIFSSSYGYMYFGFLLSPLVICLNISISMILEIFTRRAKSYEAMYVFGYCFLRVGLNLLVNTPTILTVLTMQLGTLGLAVYFCGLRFNLKGGSKKERNARIQSRDQRVG